MTIACALLAALLTAGPVSPLPPAPAAPGPAAERKKAPAAPTASLPTEAGQVLSVDHRAHRLRLRAGERELELEFDRNTPVFGPAGRATVTQLAAGAEVRIGLDGASRAAWIEVAPAPSTPRPAP
jgi:hypothetical protein